MPIYICPECETKISRKQPVEPGKKLKCPDCSHVFAVKGKLAPAKKPVSTKPLTEEEDAKVNYALTEDADSAESQGERDRAFGPLGQRFAKSKRGPALEEVVKPSNFLIGVGVLTCIMAVAGGLTSTWPMIFKQEEVQAKKTSIYDTGKQKTKFVELTPQEFKERMLWLTGCVAYFMWGAVVCAGASKMHEVETYWLAMTGAIMGFIGPFVPLGIMLVQWAYEVPADAPDMAWFGPAIIAFAAGAPISIWCISTLLKKKVKDGFADDQPIV